MEGLIIILLIFVAVGFGGLMFFVLRLFVADKEAIKTDLAIRHQELSQLVKGLEKTIEQRQLELQAIEKDRVAQFSDLSRHITEHQKITAQLELSAQNLVRVLGSNQARGGFGEKLIEDMLVESGLKQGVHYLLQAKLGHSELKPDVTLLLPDQRCVAVDVKFPLSGLQAWIDSSDSQQKQQFFKQFHSDVKKHIEKVVGYIAPDQGTLDYAVIFVPNEAVFSFINQKLVDLIDYGMSKRVLITSPFTFLIVARTIMESYRNFLIGDRLKGVLGQIEGFIAEWHKYQDGVSKLARAFDSLKNSFEELTNTRARQLQKRVDKVQQLGQGVITKLPKPKN